MKLIHFSDTYLRFNDLVRCLCAITRGHYQHIEASSEFNFFIYENGIKYPIARFSGDEICLASLFFHTAISKTLGELNSGGNIGFLALDEVFRSQDED